MWATEGVGLSGVFVQEFVSLGTNRHVAVAVDVETGCATSGPVFVRRSRGL